MKTFKEITNTPKYDGSANGIERVKDYVDNDLQGDIQLLDATQTLLRLASDSVRLAIYEMKENYTNDERKRLNDIDNEIGKLFYKIETIIESKY